MNYQECKTQISNLIKDMQDDTYSLLTIEDLESLTLPFLAGLVEGK
jgi:hypothetical protein